jgi:hypothetical protein
MKVIGHTPLKHTGAKGSRRQFVGAQITSEFSPCCRKLVSAAKTQSARDKQMSRKFRHFPLTAPQQASGGVVAGHEVRLLD